MSRDDHDLMPAPGDADIPAITTEDDADEPPPPILAADSADAHRQRVANLLRSGQVAYIRGQRDQARELWQEAASLAPYDEEVWRVLLNVAVDADDRRVCLENITAINPKNEWAASSLARLKAETGGHAAGLPRPVRRPWVWLTLDLLLILLKYGLLGVALGIAISLLLRGG